MDVADGQSARSEPAFHGACGSAELSHGRAGSRSDGSLGASAGSVEGVPRGGYARLDTRSHGAISKGEIEQAARADDGDAGRTNGQADASVLQLTHYA